MPGGMHVVDSSVKWVACLCDVGGYNRGLSMHQGTWVLASK